MSGKGQGQANNDNKADQCNPNNDKHQGHQSDYTGTGTKADLDNHGNQLNPNNPEYKGSK
jgi:hypothetical protein